MFWIIIVIEKLYGSFFCIFKFNGFFNYYNGKISMININVVGFKISVL